MVNFKFITFKKINLKSIIFFHFLLTLCCHLYKPKPSNLPFLAAWEILPLLFHYIFKFHNNGIREDRRASYQGQTYSHCLKASLPEMICLAELMRSYSKIHCGCCFLGTCKNVVSSHETRHWFISLTFYIKCMNCSFINKKLKEFINMS